MVWGKLPPESRGAFRNFGGRRESVCVPLRPEPNRRNVKDAASGPRISVLLVEDDPDQLYLLQMAAVRSGAYDQVEVASDAENAISRIAGRPMPFHVVVTDLKMPGMDGISLLQRMRNMAATEAATLVVLTSSNYPGDRARAVGSGGIRYVEKPASFEALIELMRSFGRRPEATPAR